MKKLNTVLGAIVALTLCTSNAFAQAGFGAIQTTDVSGVQTNTNTYASLLDVYLSGGGAGSNILDAGCYAYAITDTSETSLVTQVGSFYRTLAQANTQKALFNLITGLPSPNSLPGEQGGSGAAEINAPTPNGVYKLVVWQLQAGDPSIGCPQTPLTLDQLRPFSKKSDNFTIDRQVTTPVPEPGTLALLAGGALPLIAALRRRRQA